MFVFDPTTVLKEYSQHAMEEDDSPIVSMDDTIFDLYSEKSEDFCDDSQQPLLESQTSKPSNLREKYGYKQFLRIRLALLPLLVVFIALAAWMNYKLPHCKFLSSAEYHVRH